MTPYATPPDAATVTMDFLETPGPEDRYAGMRAELNIPSVSQSNVGRVLRQYHQDGYTNLGRIVHASNEQQRYYIIYYPGDRPGRPGVKHAKLNLPQSMTAVQLEDLLAANTHTLVEFESPKSWSLTEEELQAGTSLDMTLRKSRQQLKIWYEQLKRGRALVAPIFKKYTVADLLEFGALQAAVRDQTSDKTQAELIKRHVLLELLGCGHPMAQLPANERIGNPGVARHGKTKVGAQTRRFKRGLTESKGVALTLRDREKLEHGWIKYKRNNYTTVRDAWLLTCAEFWPGEEIDDGKDEYGKDKKFFLAPIDERPSLAQFRGVAAAAGLSAKKRNLGERLAAKEARRKHRDFTSRIRQLGAVGIIDSTSEDQTPVSESDRTQVLTTTWRTIYIEAKTGYILGFYSGYERPSTVTNLMAIYHGSRSHVDFCAQYGVHIKDDDWHYCLCRTILADNGEMKSERGIAALELSQVSLELARSWVPQDKGPVESTHWSAQRGVDHKLAGTTGGAIRQRGDENPAKFAARTHRENMKDFIEWVLWYNNEQPVPHLITVEMMQNDPPRPTRKGVYEWLLKYGYVATQRMDLDTLQRSCLPRFKATFSADGLEIFDPREVKEVKIRGLVYTSEWFRGSGLSGKKAKRYEVHLDPNDLSRCYFYHQGKMHELQRMTSDQRANDLCLREHLEMQDLVRDDVDSGEDGRQNSHVRRLKNIEVSNKTAAATQKKQQAEKAAAKPVEASGGAGGNRGKREATAAERRTEDLEKMGLAGMAAPPSAPVEVDGSSDDDVQSYAAFAELHIFNAQMRHTKV